MERRLCHHEYPRLGRRSKGLLRAYIERMTGFSRAQSTRLIGGYVKSGRVQPKPSLRARFPRRYTPADVELPAAVDRAHESLSGPATRHILKREFEVYGKAEFERLAKLSNGHLYNLRHSPRYGLRHYEKTRPAAVQIGERKKPAPDDRPGFLNPYVNYHRPSAQIQIQIQIDAEGHRRRLYKQWQTPFEKPLSLDQPQRFLRPGLSLNALQRVAASMSDTEAAMRMQKAKDAMFERLTRSA